MKQRYYIGNWKMYQSLSLIKKFLLAYTSDQDFDAVKADAYIGIAASHEHLYFLQNKASKIGLHVGAQNCSSFLQGAYTGQVSVESLQEIGLSFSLIGHSEVRRDFAETDMIIASKFKLLIAANISPILCIGETFIQKNDGITLQVLYDQLEHVLEFLQSYSGSTKIFIAYEPVYSIGTGIIPSQEDLQQVFSFLHKIVEQVPVAKNVMFLYGGSVSGKTVNLLDNINEISGFLIGKSSIDFQELKKIVQSDGRMV